MVPIPTNPDVPKILVVLMVVALTSGAFKVETVPTLETFRVTTLAVPGTMSVFRLALVATFRVVE